MAEEVPGDSVPDPLERRPSGPWSTGGGMTHVVQPARIAARSRAKNGKSGRLPVAIENRHGADLAITALAGVVRERTLRRPTTPELVRVVGPR